MNPYACLDAAAPPNTPDNAIQRRALAEALVADALRSTQPVVLIYQMAKVGSDAIFRTLLDARIPHPIFKPHSLGPGVLARYQQLAGAGAPIPTHLEIEAALIRGLFSRSPLPPLIVITMMRDPIARELSHFFEGIRSQPFPLFDGTGRLYPEAALHFLTQILLRPDACDRSLHWFDQEIKQFLHFDVLRHPFDTDRGWSLYHTPELTVLALQTESISSSGPQALAELFHLPNPPTITPARIREQMPFGPEYRHVRERLRLPQRACQRIYGHPTVRHFYSERQIQQFLARWSAQPPAT